MSFALDHVLDVFVVQSRFDVLKFDTYIGFTFAAYTSVYVTLFVYIASGSVACIPEYADVEALIAASTNDPTGLAGFRNLVCGTDIKWHALGMYCLKVGVLAVMGAMMYNNARLTHSFGKLLASEFATEDERTRFVCRANMERVPLALRTAVDRQYEEEGPPGGCAGTLRTVAMLGAGLLVPAIYTRYRTARHAVFFSTVPRTFVAYFQNYWVVKTIQTPLCMLTLGAATAVSYAVPAYRRILMPESAPCDAPLVWAHGASATLDHVCHFESEFVILVLWILVQALAALLLALMCLSWLNASVMMYSKHVYAREAAARNFTRPSADETL